MADLKQLAGQAAHQGAGPIAVIVAEIQFLHMAEQIPTDVCVMEFFLSILSVAVIAAGGVLIMRGELNTVDLITFSLYITTFVNPVRKLANFSELLANGTAGFSRFLELMRTEPAMKDAPDAVEPERMDRKNSITPLNRPIAL